MENLQSKWALITGASSGIGTAFAKALSKQGTNLILVARREDRLRQLANQLETAHKISTQVIPMDLSDIDSAKKLIDEIKKIKLPVNILVNNAGIGVFGRAHETDTEKNAELIKLNVYTLVMLTQYFLKEMVEAKEGMIFNIASTAAFQSLPYMANYGASKAFVLSYTEALWAEYRNDGIKILAVCPGPVATEFFQVMGSDINTLGPKDNADTVVYDALRAIRKNKCYVIPGSLKNYILAQLSRFFPRKWSVLISEKIMRKG